MSDQQKHWTHAEIDAALQEAIALQYELDAMTKLAEERRNRAKLAEDTVQMLQGQLTLLRAECEAWRQAWDGQHIARKWRGMLELDEEAQPWIDWMLKARAATDAAGALRGEGQ